jgi:hypothetical protein
MISWTTETNRWTQLPPAPLKPRRDAMGAWTGSEPVVAGGAAFKIAVG